MVSQRQHEANRRNAARSNGPTTPEGRAAVRRNALKQVREKKTKSWSQVKHELGL